MAPLLGMLRKDYKWVIASREALCSEQVYEVGELVLNDESYLLINQISDIGNSCRGVSNLLIFKEQKFIGFYRNNLTFEFKIEENNLMVRGEFTGPFSTLKMNEKLPDTLAVDFGRPFQKASDYETKN